MRASKKREQSKKMENRQSVCVFSDPGEEEKLPGGFLPFALCFCPGLVVCRKRGGDQGREQSVWQEECTCDLGRSRIKGSQRTGEQRE